MQDRPVKEVEITPQMIEAGSHELHGFDEDRESADEAVERIYRAMLAACPLVSRVARLEE
jgi:hypothetical protein